MKMELVNEEGYVMKIQYLDIDGMTNCVRQVPKEKANVARILYDDDSTLAEIELDPNHEIPWDDLLSACKLFSQSPDQ